MSKRLYCWRCRCDIPMLEEHEWDEVWPLIREDLEEEKRYGRDYRERWQTNIPEGRVSSKALDRYFELTGFRETNINALWHHQVALYGPPCGECGKPLRTARAKFCAACGAEVR